MREGVALFGHALRSRARAPGSAALAALAAAALAGTALARPAAGAGGAAALANALLVAGLAAAFAAAATGGVLPDDRASGRAEWLGTLRPSPATHRLAAAAAGVAIAVVVGLSASGLVAALLVGAGRPVATSHATPLVVSEDARSERRAFSATLPPASDGPARTVEWDVVPFVVDLSAEPPATLDAVLEWRVGDVGGTRALVVPYRGSARVEVPARAAVVRLSAADPRAPVLPRVTGARVIGARRSFVLNVLAAGLLLGLGCACVAPLAVLVSRGTSAPTAALAAAVALLVGVLREPLLSLSQDVVATAPEARRALPRLAAGVVSAATALAPDLRALAAVGEASAGRTVPASAFAALGPAGLHAAAVALLLLVPAPRRRR